MRSRRGRAALVRGTAAAAVLLGCVELGCAEGERPFGPGPAENLILISVDTLRADRLGAYGYPHETSPAIDRLARQGALFERCYSTSNWTLPSHTSLFTGLYPMRHGVRREEHALGDTATLTRLLRDAGYATAGFASSTLLARRGIGRDFERYELVLGPDEVNPAETITTGALGWLAERDDGPFFLFVHYYDPHLFYTADPEYRARFGAGELDLEHWGKVAMRGVLDASRVSAEEAVQLGRLYDAEIRQLDDQIARLLERLEASGLARTTAVILTSDHGEELREHGAFFHGKTYYEEVARVPLVLRGPGIPAALRVASLASLVDVVPTALALLGRAAPAGLEGVDLTAHWREGAQAPERRFVFAEANRARHADLHMVRGPRYKLLADRRRGSRRLYDLAEDPGEQRDLSTERPEVADAMLEELTAHLRAGVAGRPRTIEVPPAEREALREIGYLE